jgi:flagellar biosynthesis activator protein FlaF
MNSLQMARTAYSSSRPSIRTPRSTEYDVFARITQNIKSASEKGKSGFSALVSALHENRNLWRILALDVADDNNALPDQLRARILYLAEFTDLHTRRILAREADAASLIEINTTIMRGLRGMPEVAS